ncbi:uncharacterized protein LOC129914240 isoform X2 [Episyrphus balteatus]|nr:uncharacterized protein LOC129914240 isoform X2 [Episyrphus balteatus]XP_055849376.1 uncharacterized protein LOC129914240 isoform X2 [Episyrphus balteatus]XP_055849377.1 uncharacterized protein LOC129914240 isoform X2 [Episyrphus balteatus]
MCHPIPQWNLPALDPFEIKNEEIQMDNNIFKNFTASVKDFKATGLSNFKINEIKIKTLSQKFTLNLTFPLEEVQSKYKAKGSLGYVVNLVGDDNMTGHLKEVNIVVTGGIKIGLKFGIKNLNIKFGIGELFVDMGKLMEHDRVNNFIHNLINDLTIELLGDFWEDYGQPLTKKIENMMNKKMASYALKDIIGIISGTGQPIFGDSPPGDCKNNVQLD